MMLLLTSAWGAGFLGRAYDVLVELDNALTTASSTSSGELWKGNSSTLVT